MSVLPIAMRVWIDPVRLAERNLAPGDVHAALQRNNYLAAVGQTKGDLVQVNLLANTDLRSVDEFKNLIVANRGTAELVGKPPEEFIGRNEEFAEITGLLVHEGVQLLTLTGVGGVGKSVERGAGQPCHSEPEQGCHHRVVQVLSQCLDRALAHLGGIEPHHFAAHDAAEAALGPALELAGQLDAALGALRELVTRRASLQLRESEAAQRLDEAVAEAHAADDKKRREVIDGALHATGESAVGYLHQTVVGRLYLLLSAACLLAPQALQRGVFRIACLGPHRARERHGLAPGARHDGGGGGL